MVEINFDHIETAGNIFIFQFFKVGIGGQDQPALFGFGYRCGRSSPGIFATGFDLDKDKGLLMTADDVDFPPAGSIVAGQNLVTVLAKEGGGGLFAQTAGIVFRIGRRGEEAGAREQTSGDGAGTVPEPEEPCSGGRCRSLCVC